MKALNIFGQALLVALAAIGYVIVGLVYLPFLIAYYVIVGVFTVGALTVCAILVMVYKLAAWLTRLSR